MRLLLGLALALSLLGIAWAQQVLPPVVNGAMVCAYNTTTPTGTNLRFMYVQCDINGQLRLAQ